MPRAQADAKSAGWASVMPSTSTHRQHDLPGDAGLEECQVALEMGSPTTMALHPLAPQKRTIKKALRTLTRRCGS